MWKKQFLRYIYLLGGLLLLGAVIFPAQATSLQIAPLELTLLQTLEHSSPINDVSWSHKGEYLAVLEETGMISIWDSTNWQVLSNFNCGVFPTERLKWSPIESRLAVGCVNFGSTISVERVNDQLTIIKFDSRNQSPGWSLDGSQLAFPQPDGTIQILNSALELIYMLGEPVPSFELQRIAYFDFKWSLSGQYFAAIGRGQAPIITIWDLTTQQRVRDIVNALDIVWRTDGNTFVITLQDSEARTGSIQTWSTSSFELLSSVSIPYDDEAKIVESPIKNHYVAYCETGATLELYDSLTGSPVILTFPGGNISCPVDDIALSPTGILAVTESNGRVTIWQVIDSTQPTPTPMPTATATPSSSDLAAKVTECVLDRGIRNSLTVKITNQQWGAFINEVNAQCGKKITVECAADLIEMATYLRDHP